MVHPTILADADPPTIKYMVKLNPESTSKTTNGTPNDFGEWQPSKFSERTVIQISTISNENLKMVHPTILAEASQPNVTKEKASKNQ